MLDDELLIELVRGQPALYDFTNTHYSDAAFKMQKWQELGHILKQDAEKVKTRWESLRNQFRRFIRLKKKKAAGRYSGLLANWKHYESMQFLKPHMRDKKRNTSAESNADADDHVYWPTDETDDAMDRTQELEVEISPSPLVTASSHHMSLRSYGIHAKQKSPEPDENATSILLKYILDKEKSKKDRLMRSTADDIDLFFDSIKATVRKLSEKNKILAKQRVFTIVNELEGINLNEMQHINAGSAQYCQQSMQYPTHPHHPPTT